MRLIAPIAEAVAVYDVETSVRGQFNEYLSLFLLSGFVLLYYQYWIQFSLIVE